MQSSPDREREEKLWLPETLIRLRGPHERKLATHFGELGDGAIDLPDTIRFVFVCFTNRCGSNFFAEVLASGGRINKAMEFLNADYVLQRAAETGTGTFKDYVSWFVRSEAVNGCFTAKIALEQLVMLARHGVLSAIADRTRFVMIERRDKLAQAISIDIAEQTGQWAWYLPAAKSVEELAYSYRKLSLFIEWICSTNFNLARFFGHNGLVADTVFYEDFVADPQAYADRVASMLALAPFPIDFDKIDMRKQATDTNELWRTRYLTDRAAP